MGYGAKSISSIDGNKERELIGSFLGFSDDKIDIIILRNTPVSNLFGPRESNDYFHMVTHWPENLNKCDVTLVTDLTGKNGSYIDPVTTAGQKVAKTRLKYIRRNLRDCGENMQPIWENNI